jgi:starch synthase
MDFGVFPRTGFYDWKLIKFQAGGKIASVYTGLSQAGSLSASMSTLDTLETTNVFTPGTKPIQGRFIIHPKGTLDLQLHEIMADYPEGLTMKNHLRSFKRIAEKIPGYAKSGINALYVMGALERDNNLAYGEDGKVMWNVVRKPIESSPLAIINRTLPNSLLGGAEGLEAMIQVAKQKGVRIILDFVTRIGSSKFHKKYAPYTMFMIDSKGKKVPFFGSDGRGWDYEDTAVLNFR